MRCEHGIDVAVVIEKVSPPYWDDGVCQFDEQGVQEWNGKFLKVEGCPDCRMVRIAGDS